MVIPANEAEWRFHTAPNPAQALPAKREPDGRQLDEEEAHELTKSIRRDARSLWIQLVRAYEGNAHGALGYRNWAVYCEAEFKLEKARTYRLLQWARVVEFVDDSQSPMGNSFVDTQRVAREFAPLLAQAEILREVHAEVIEAAPRDAEGHPVVTVALARETVAKHRSDPPPPAVASSFPTSNTTARSTAASEPNSESKRTPTAVRGAASVMRRTIECDPDEVENALRELGESTQRELDHPKIRDVSGPLVDLFELVAWMFEARG